MLYHLSYLAEGATGIIVTRYYDTSKLLAEPTGFEPATFCVTGRYANPYTTAPHTKTPEGKRHDTERFRGLSTRVEGDLENDRQQHHATDVEVAVKRP